MTCLVPIWPSLTVVHLSTVDVAGKNRFPSSQIYSWALKTEQLLSVFIRTNRMFLHHTDENSPHFHLKLTSAKAKDLIGPTYMSEGEIHGDQYPSNRVRV